MGLTNTSEVDSQKYLSLSEVKEQFPLPLQWLYSLWSRVLVHMSQDEETQSALQSVQQELLTTNVAVFFLHDYTLDPFPVAAALLREARNLQHIVAPYAILSQLGVSPEGEETAYFRRRARWLMGMKQRLEATGKIHLFPVIREFEKNNPFLSALIQERGYSTVNREYFRGFNQWMREKPSGSALFIAPHAGLSKPGRSVLHRDVYGPLDKVQQRLEQGLPTYVVFDQPVAPFGIEALTERVPGVVWNKIYFSGPEYLPTNDYPAALQQMQQREGLIRQKTGLPIRDTRSRK